MLIYDELEQKVTLHKKSIDSSLANVDEGEELVFEGASEPLKLEMQHFLDCCKTGATPTSHIQSAVEVVKILEKAGKSVLC
jgi:predicted dehydrogenase